MFALERKHQHRKHSFNLFCDCFTCVTMSTCYVCFWRNVRSNFNTREINSRENNRLLGHNSEPCGNFGTILRHKLPIIHPDLPIPTRDPNSSVQPEFLHPKFLYRNPKNPIKSCIFLTYGRPGRTIGSSQLYRKREKDASKTPSLAQASANAPNPHQTHIWTAKVAQTCI